MGFKKQGISIMFLFWGVFAIGACTGMDWLVFLIPIIWFYSFFNVHNLKSLSEEEFYSIEDSYVLHMDELAGDISSLLKHHGKIPSVLAENGTFKKPCTASEVRSPMSLNRSSIPADGDRPSSSNISLVVLL